MPHTFPSTAQSALIVGRTPWSAPQFRKDSQLWQKVCGIRQSCLRATGSKNHRGEWAPNPGTDRTGSEFPAKCAGNPCQSCQSRGRSWVAMKSAWQFFMNFRGPKAHPNRVEKPPRTSGNLLRLPAFFMKFRGPKAHPNRGEKPPRGVGSEPGDRQDWQRISGKMRRKSMPVLSVPGALVGGDEVTMAVFHELSRAEGPSQQWRKTTAGSGLRTRGQTGLAANFRQNSP